MTKQKHIIVLNGRHYNAKTGEPLSHAAGHQTPKPVAAAAVRVAHPVSHAPKAAPRKTTRQSASHVKAHAPKPARTLMRHAVKKPSGSIKRHIRAQGHLDSQIKQPEFPPPRPRAGEVRRRTVKTSKVHLISHFSPNLFTTVTQTTVVTTQPRVSRTPAPHQMVKSPVNGTLKRPRTTAELLEYAINYADAPAQPEEPVRQRHVRHRFKRRAHAAAH